MKRKILFLFLAIILLFAIMPVSSISAADNKLVWLIEPELEYDWIRYCKHCDVLRNKNVSQIREIINEYDYQKDGSGFWLADGHGYGTAIYFYDEEKNIIAVHYSSESGGGIDYYSFDEFIINNSTNRDKNWLIPVRKANSEKMVKDESTGWAELDENYIGDKYALFYGDKFITGFIYDDYDSRGVRHMPNDLIDMKLNGKYGIIDKNANTAIQFIFDDIEFINDNIAFAKYNGKYGILDVEKTILAVNNTKSPATGENNMICVFSLLFIFSFLIIKNKFYREKN